MADYNSSKSSSSCFSCNGSSESDLYHRSRSDKQGTGNSEQTENKRLRYKVNHFGQSCIRQWKAWNRHSITQQDRSD
jgi:hypothetical protein